ncbi:hypothetical protein HK405_014390 [Cladochytrium tenue]|nr:hypothetical protein HK405_014390 [Cladochytrium tenue]
MPHLTKVASASAPDGLMEPTSPIPPAPQDSQRPLSAAAPNPVTAVANSRRPTRRPLRAMLMGLISSTPSLPPLSATSPTSPTSPTSLTLSSPGGCSAVSSAPRMPSLDVLAATAAPLDLAPPSADTPSGNSNELSALVGDGTVNAAGGVEIPPDFGAVGLDPPPEDPGSPVTDVPPRAPISNEDNGRTARVGGGTSGAGAAEEDAGPSATVRPVPPQAARPHAAPPVPSPGYSVKRACQPNDRRAPNNAVHRYYVIENDETGLVEFRLKNVRDVPRIG